MQDNKVVNKCHIETKAITGRALLNRFLFNKKTNSSGLNVYVVNYSQDPNSEKFCSLDYVGEKRLDPRGELIAPGKIARKSDIASFLNSTSVENLLYVTPPYVDNPNLRKFLIINPETYNKKTLTRQEVKKIVISLEDPWSDKIEQKYCSLINGYFKKPPTTHEEVIIWAKRFLDRNDKFYHALKKYLNLHFLRNGNLIKGAELVKMCKYFCSSFQGHECNCGASPFIEANLARWNLIKSHVSSWGSLSGIEKFLRQKYKFDIDDFEIFPFCNFFLDPKGKLIGNDETMCFYLMPSFCVFADENQKVDYVHFWNVGLNQIEFCLSRKTKKLMFDFSENCLYLADKNSAEGDTSFEILKEEDSLSEKEKTKKENLLKTYAITPLELRLKILSGQRQIWDRIFADQLAGGILFFADADNLEENERVRGQIRAIREKQVATWDKKFPKY